MKHRPAAIVAAGVILTSIVMTWYLQGGKKRPTLRQKHREPLALPHYSDSEQKQFWALHLEKLIMEELPRGTYRLKEIAQHYSVLAQIINQRSGPLRICAITQRHPLDQKDQRIVAGAWYDQGIPKLELHIPTLMDIHQELKRHGEADWQSQFENKVVIGVMHEMEHLASDPQHGDDTKTKEGLIKVEKRAWAATCRHTLIPLVEHYHEPLAAGDKIFYAEWKKAGEDENSSSWDQFFQNSYGKLRE